MSYVDGMWYSNSLQFDVALICWGNHHSPRGHSTNTIVPPGFLGFSRTFSMNHIIDFYCWKVYTETFHWHIVKPDVTFLPFYNVIFSCLALYCQRGNGTIFLDRVGAGSGSLTAFLLGDGKTNMKGTWSSLRMHMAKKVTRESTKNFINNTLMIGYYS